MLKDKKITILYDTSNGEAERPTWGPLQGASNIWAYYRAVSGKEFYAAAQTQHEEDVLFVINYHSGINESMHIKFQNGEYEIVRIDNFEGYKADIKLYCKIVTAGG